MKRRFINGINITHFKHFAYDGCHKIYLLENRHDEAEALAEDYKVYPIRDLVLCFVFSCPLRFIDTWSLEPIVRQGDERVIFNGFNKLAEKDIAGIYAYKCKQTDDKVELTAIVDDEEFWEA